MFFLFWNYSDKSRKLSNDVIIITLSAILQIYKFRQQILIRTEYHAGRLNLNLFARNRFSVCTDTELIKQAYVRSFLFSKKSSWPWWKSINEPWLPFFLIQREKQRLGQLMNIGNGQEAPSSIKEKIRKVFWLADFR